MCLKRGKCYLETEDSDTDQTSILEPCDCKPAKLVSLYDMICEGSVSQLANVVASLYAVLELEDGSSFKKSPALKQS